MNKILETMNITNDIKKIENMTVLITGSTSGLGMETARFFAEHKATVVMGVRSVSKGEALKVIICKEFPYAKIDVLELELTSLKSVETFSKNFKNKYKQLNILFNNAGITVVPEASTIDGLPSQVGINHVSHFLLDALLLDVIKNTPQARVVTTSSLVHPYGNIQLEKLFQVPFYENDRKAYFTSKLLNLLFTYELQRYFEKNNIDALSVSAHPGISTTNLSCQFPSLPFHDKLHNLSSYFFQSPKMGALGQIFAGVSDTVKGGQYYGPSGFGQIYGYPKLHKSSKTSYDTKLAKDVWNATRSLILDKTKIDTFPS